MRLASLVAGVGMVDEDVDLTGFKSSELTDDLKVDLAKIKELIKPWEKLEEDEKKIYLYRSSMAKEALNLAIEEEDDEDARSALDPLTLHCRVDSTWQSGGWAASVSKQRSKHISDRKAGIAAKKS